MNLSFDGDDIVSKMLETYNCSAEKNRILSIEDKKIYYAGGYNYYIYDVDSNELVSLLEVPKRNTVSMI